MWGRDNAGQLRGNQLCWGDMQVWEAGTLQHRPCGQKQRTQAGWVMLLKIIVSCCL